MPQIIYQDPGRGLAVFYSPTPSPELLRLLEGTVWGTRGVRYTKHGLAEALERLPAPLFFDLREEGRLAAGGVCLKKTVRVGDNSHEAIFTAALAVDPAQAGQGYGKFLAQQARDWLLGEVKPGTILYGYIEAGNVRALKLGQQVGRQSLGSFEAVLFSRLRPREDARIRCCTPGEREELVILLHTLYGDHALLDFDHSVRNEDYYILRQGGKIAAGLQAEVQRWHMRSLPGLRGWLLVKLLPVLPVLGRRFDPRDFRFLKFSNFYLADGREGEAFPLMESLLARHRVNFAMAYMDRRSPLYQRLARAGHLGVLGAGLKISAQVMADFKGWSDWEIQAICRRPLHISPLDAL